MKWFLERISGDTLPVEFGYSERQQYKNDFELLIQKKTILHSGNLNEIDCTLCEDDDHSCQARNDNGRLFYVCDNGNGTQELTNEMLAIYRFHPQNFMTFLCEELGIEIDRGSHKDEAYYTQNSFYRLGTYADKKKKISFEVYYLRNKNDFEASMHFSNSGTSNQLLITNTMKADLPQKDIYSCVLSMILNTQNNEDVFETKLFLESFEAHRRVHFDTKEGNLLIDGKRILTVGKDGHHHHFLSFLWKNWMKQKTHDEVRTYVMSKTKDQGKSETGQKFCQKLKSEIKKKCTAENQTVFDTIITTPTTGHYMMADPL
jgi:hypothetical protein